MINLTPDEYTLFLSTGEELHVSVIQLASLGVNENVVSLCSSVLDLCTQATHEEIEEAKMGYDTNFKKKMKSPPVGCLSRVDKPVCGEINHCAMAVKNKCTTRSIQSMKTPTFPLCWTYQTDNYDAKAIVDTIVHSWRRNRHVILVVA